MLKSHSTTNTSPLQTNDLAELDDRMRRPQRHRLLQGYPMAPVMRPLVHEAPLPAHSGRPVIMGVLPHPFCNPTVRGCGFCTFPHQKFHRSVSERVVDAVQTEIDRRVDAIGWLRDADIPAVYIGGGTANLVPPDSMAALYDKLVETFDLTQAEFSLEGAPRYFLTRDFAHLDLIAGLDVAHRRISMGVQTFDEGWLQKMGRMAIGAPEHVEQAVAAAQSRGITTSCDLLYNLPGQSQEAMLADVERAAALGFDQICVYHLVLYHGLGTEWSKDEAMLAATPGRRIALRNWLAVRGRLFELGYSQSTLTNFERTDLPESRRFRYEALSFQPEAVDGIGFGPSGISTFASMQAPWKTMNYVDASAYVDAVEASENTAERGFRYAPLDQILLHLTRQIPLMRIRRDSAREQLGADPFATFGREFEALQSRELVTIGPDEIRLTPRGMFYADSIAGLLANQRMKALRAHPRLNSAEPHFMG